MSAMRVAGELLGLGDPAHVVDRLGAAEGFEEAVRRPAQAAELDELDDQQGPGEDRAGQQADHHDLHDQVGLFEHDDRRQLAVG